jgi:Uma2 family endonuclease
MATHSIPQVTEEEYLRLERAAEYRSEFVDGQILAMAGGGLRHSQLAANWTIELGFQIRGRNCRVLTSDARVRTAATGSYVYPDVSVVCGAGRLHQNATDVFTNPTVVIEVLSPSTANYDRGKKFELYREIASLQDYILVHTGSPQVEHFARQADASWLFREYRGTESAVPIASIECSARLADVYQDVFEWPE